MASDIESQIKEKSKRAAICARAATRMYHVANSLQVRGNDKDGYDLKLSTSIMSPLMTKPMAEGLQKILQSRFNDIGEQYEDLARFALAAHSEETPIGEDVIITDPELEERDNPE